MALYKEITTHKGVNVNYHRVDNVSLNHDRTLNCVLQSFVSKDYATTNNQIQELYLYFRNITPEEEETNGIRELAYKKIKEMPEWADAQDC